MIENFKLEGTEDTPEVILNKETNTFLIKGRSLPEDAYIFYKPIIEWFAEYSSQPNAATALSVSLDYFNSSSVKQLLDLFSQLKNIIASGHEAKIIWNYSEDDDLMEIKGLEFKSMLNIPFEIKAY